MIRINLWALLILPLLIYLNLISDFYFNIYTHSLPYGIYMKVNGIPQRGEYAASCLTPDIARYGIARAYLAAGNCSTGTVRVLKVIAGMPGDRYILKNGFLELNGRTYAIMPEDSHGRPLKVFYKAKTAKLTPGQYMLLSNFVKNSWDSRYWGPVNIQFLLKPLWVW